MQKPAIRGIVTVLFLGLLATPLVLKRLWYSDDVNAQAAAATGVDEALRRSGFHLEEVSKASGIDFVQRRRSSTRSSTTSCRRSPRWARRSRSSTSIATAGRTSTSPTAARAA